VAPDSNRVRAGLRREDLFTIVLEHFQTDTADYADYLLPATTFLEHPDLYTSYGHYHLQWADAIVPARGECRSNTQIFAAIGRHLNLSEPSLFWSAEELAGELLTTDHPALAGITLEELKKAGSIKLRLADPFLPYARGSHHKDKKVQFSPPPEQLTFEEQTSDEFPLRLISPPGPFIVNTTMGNLESIRKMAGGQPRVLLHPNDAAIIHVESGATIRLVSRQGSIERQVVVTDETLPGVVIALGQWWPKLAPDRRSLNDLTSQRLTDLGGGSTFGNTVVRAEAIPTACGASHHLRHANAVPTSV
jgi:anaerobic selenocysteine-containing dehydrogenase